MFAILSLDRRGNTVKILYRLIKTEQNGREVYGIEIAKQICDVFHNQNDGERFVGLCNTMNVSEAHIDDMIQDYLLESENVL